MKNIFMSFFLLGLLCTNLFADTNSSKSTDGNNTDLNSSAKKSILDKQVREQMKREEKYAREQAFYQGSDYNLSEHEVDPASLSSVPAIEPEYDFDIDDVYNDSPDL